MGAQTKFGREVEALVPGGGEGLDLPEAIRAEWDALPTHRESPSSIVSFLECPLKWFAERHLEKMHAATGETLLGITEFTKQPPNQWAVGGTLAHRALEVFYSDPPDFRTQELLEDIYDFAWERLDRGDWSDGIVSKSMVKDYNTMLKSIDQPLKSFKARFRSTYRDITLADLDMEKPPAVRVEGNESFINMKRGRMTVFGKIDREDLTLKGGIKIVDYKTGRAPAGEISVFNKTFLPAGIYALARTEETEGLPTARPVVGVQLLYLKELERCSIGVDDEVLDDVSDIVEMVEREMGEIGRCGVVPTAPAKSLNDMPCKWCPLREICPEWN